MKKILILTAAMLSLSVCSIAQRKSDGGYTTAAGIKFSPSALSVKHFLSEGTAVEGLGYLWSKAFRITALYEVHHDLDIVDNLRWYYGGGAHVGFYASKYGGGTGIGIDGVLGLDYKLSELPLNLSLDWQPSFEFGNSYGNGFTGNWGGIAVRYTF